METRMAPKDDAAENLGPAYAPVTDDELHGYYFEDLKVGMTAVYSKTVTEADIVAFGGVSGDTNPVHMSEQFGQAGMFQGRIAHGMLSAAYISKVIGTTLPGPGAIYMGQTLKFMAPVRAGDTVNTRVTVRELNDEKARAILDTICSVGEDVVIEGEALIKVPLRNPPDD
jgi:3-hydroxybutyryl-CoA dehydratase